MCNVEALFSIYVMLGLKVFEILYVLYRDETTDISGIDQFFLCIRYVDTSDNSAILRNFLKFVPVEDLYTTKLGYLSFKINRNTKFSWPGKSVHKVYKPDHQTWIFQYFWIRTRCVSGGISQWMACIFCRRVAKYKGAAWPKTLISPVFGPSYLAQIRTTCWLLSTHSVGESFRLVYVFIFWKISELIISTQFWVLQPNVHHISWIFIVLSGMWRCKNIPKIKLMYLILKKQQQCNSAADISGAVMARRRRVCLGYPFQLRSIRQTGANW